MNSASELDSLRSQVADLLRELAEQARVSRELNRRLDFQGQDQGKRAGMFRAIIKGIAAATGGDVFRMLVRGLAETLNVRHVFVGEWYEDRPDHVRTVAVWSGTTFAEPFEYCLQGTPCANVVGHRFCLYGSDVQRLFPDDDLLVEMKVESYCGMPLFDHLGKPLGLLVVMDEMAMSDTAFIQDVLSIFAGRAASELERTRVENERAKALELLNNVIETVPDIIFTLDLQGNLVEWNKRMEVVTDLSPKELKDRPVLAFVPESEHAQTGMAIQSLHPDDVDRAQRALRAHFEGQSPYDLELRLWHRDGHYRWFRARGKAIRDKEGRPYRVVGSITDIAEQKRAELLERERLTRVIRFKEAQLRLDRLSHENLSQDFRMITRMGAETVGVERVSIWLFNVDHSTLVCEDLYRLSLDRHDSGAILESSGYPIYFESLECDLPLAASDARTDPRTSEFAVSYLEPQGIVSMMDIAVRWDGRIIGLVCFEQTGVKREWSSEAQAFAVSMADHVALCLADEERRQAEQALRESKERFSKAFNETAIGMALVSVGGRWLQVNQALCVMLGYSQEELEATTIQAITYPEDCPANVRFINGVLSGELRTFHMETRYLRKQGHVVWAILSVSIVRNSDGSPQHLILQIQDITERKRAEFAFHESEELHRALFDQSPLMCFLLDAEGTVLKVNRLGADALGYDMSELLGQPVLMVFPEDVRALAMQHIADCLAGPTDALISWELQKQRKDGSRLWVRESARLMIDREGRSTLLILCDDISERKQAEEKLRLTNHFLQTLIDTSPLGIVGLHKSDGQVTLWNSAAERILGWRVDEVLGRPLPCVPVGEEERSQVIWEQVDRGGILNGTEARWLRKDGTSIDVVLWGTGLGDFHGIRSGSFCFLADVTERKRTEEARVASERRLARMTDSIPGAVYQYQLLASGEQRILFMSRNITHLIGVTAEDCLHDFNVLWGRILAEDIHELQQSVQKSAQMGHVWEHEFRLRTTGGAIKWIRGQSTPEPAGSDGSRIWNGILLDITERKRMEEELRERERALRLALEERGRISEDLHDGILQSIFAVGLGLESYRTVISKLPLPRKKTAAPLMAALSRAIGQLNLVMTEVRNFIAGLESRVLQGGDAASALRTMVQAMCASNATACRVMIEEAAARELSTEQAFHVINVAREALSNSRRHSEARRITVSLKRLRRSVRLSVRDNGIGFAPASVCDHGHGLANMAARARKLGGRFDVHSQPRRGTNVRCDIPRRSIDE